MNIDKNGKYFGNAEGENVSYWITGPALINSNNPMISKARNNVATVIAAKEFFGQLQNLMACAGSRGLPVILPCTILGEAYWMAIVNHCGGEHYQIPSAGEFYGELKKLFNDIEARGWIIDEDWKEAAEMLDKLRKKEEA